MDIIGVTGSTGRLGAQVAQLLATDVRQQRLVVRDVARDAARRRRGVYELWRLFHAPEWLLDARVSTYTAIASGAMSRVSNDIKHITGHPTTTLIDVVRAQK